MGGYLGRVVHMEKIWYREDYIKFTSSVKIFLIRWLIRFLPKQREVIMSAPKSTLWSIEPHTRAKHEILRRYLGAWFPILSKYNGRIIYMDGFSGPGEYSQGEPGSPIIALDVANSYGNRLTREVVFFFVDEQEDRIEHLTNIIGQKNYPTNLKVYTYHDEFHRRLGAILDRTQIAPTFAFIDPFGFSGVPMSLIEKLIGQPKTEVFITFMGSYVNRFLENEKVISHIIELFGTDEVLKIPSTSINRANELRELYQIQLQKSARFIRYFQMKDRHNKPIYDLFFAGNNDLGHYRMKDAMWKVDPDGEFSFSDSTNSNQLVLFSAEDTYIPQLLDNICQHFGSGRPVTTKAILKWVRDDTPYLESHMRKAMRLGEEQGRILVTERKLDGKPRRKGSFPEGVIVRFV